MSDKTPWVAILRPGPGPHLLDRMGPPSCPLSENQILVDQMVSSSMSEATKGSSLLAMLGAGSISRFTRMGVLSLSLGEGSAFLSILTRGGSSLIALAHESAAFTAIERGFHPSRTSFEKDWALSLINLGSIKLLGGISQGQNLILQHLVTDLGMVGSQQAGARLGLVEKPRGNFMQQMVQAEALNWSMKGGMALLHGLSPNLLPMEKSWDLVLKSQGTDLFPQGTLLQFLSNVTFGQAALLRSEENLMWMSQQGEGPKKPFQRPVPLPRVSRPPIPRSDPPRAERVRLSFTPPAPTAAVLPMSEEQILLLSQTAGEIQGTDFRVIPITMVAAELSHADFASQAKEYFDYAATLIQALPDPGKLKGLSLSHFALEQARIGDPAACKANFGEAMQVLNRLQAVPQRTPETTLEAYELILEIAADLITVGRTDTALQFLSVATPKYQQVLKGPPPLGFGTGAVMKLARQGQFEGARTLVGQIPNPEGQRKILLELGNFYARRGEIKKADEILWRLRGTEEKETLHAEIAQAHALGSNWTLALQHLSAIKSFALHTDTIASLARIAFLSGNSEYARTLQEEAVHLLHDPRDLLSAEALSEISAVLASNYSLWGDDEGHSRYYYRALGELEPSEKVLAELVLGLQVANQGEKIVDRLKDVDRKTRSSVMGEAALKLAEIGRSNLAVAWLGLIPELDRSGPQKKITLRLLEMGQADQALPFAEKIPDPRERFDTLWEIFAHHRGRFSSRA